ncbi:Purpurin [Bagarius yarrelli]|uniref:Purpurin n=1 Tax=Bagarius yarrelli TaxID=175774 RepID=A0A556V6Q3_BAGYA|nr:Purpurin [Bagarius yarrelli]
MDCYKFALLVVLLSYIERCWSSSCVVDSFSVKQDFDPKKYAGKWYAQQKKDPEGLFLQDNISAEYTIEEDGTMIASSKGRVTLFGFWVVCADMAAQYTVPDPSTPGKMFMNYQGLASYLSSGGDNYWIIDTDYDNYAITYACRFLKDDGTCNDGYALVFSRNPRGLPPAIQRIVRQKQEEICMAGQFKPVLQSGQCTNTHLDIQKHFSQRIFINYHTSVGNFGRITNFPLLFHRSLLSCPTPSFTTLL